MKRIDLDYSQEKIEGLRIGVLMGGVSTEREVSLKTGEKMFQCLEGHYQGLQKIVLDTKSDVFETCSDLDFALIALHGKYGEDGQIQSILDAMDIPYSGCNMKSSAVAMDKDLTKVILRAKGITTADWLTVKHQDEAHLAQAFLKEKGKVVVKPNSGGSSVMTFVCENAGEVSAAIEQVLIVDEEVIIEEFLEGMEITVPILNGKILPTLKISADGFFDYVAKYQSPEEGGAKEEVVELEADLARQVNDLTLRTFQALKSSVYGRVDFIVSQGKPYVLELNTLPGMTAASLVPKSAQAAGLSYRQVVEEIIKGSLRERKLERVGR